MPDNNHDVQDDFSFEDFLSPESQKELGGQAATSTTEAAPVAEIATPTEVVETTSPQAATQAEAPEVQTTETTTEEKVDEVPVDANAPVRAANEPEWRYNYRVEIYEKQKELKTATTVTDKEAIKTEVNGIRKQLANRSKADDEIEDDGSASQVQVDPNNIATIVNQQLRINQEIETIGRAEMDFLKRNPILKAQQDKYDNLISYVLDTYNLQGKSYNAISVILEDSLEKMYPKKIDSKIVQTKELSQKMDAVDFSGSTASESVDPVKDEARTLNDSIKAQGGNDFSWALDI